MDNDKLTVNECAYLLNVSHPTLYSYIKDNRIKSEYDERLRRRFFDRADVEAFNATRRGHTLETA